MTDILQACKTLVSEDVLDDMVVDLIKVVRRGAGISTRAGAANFLVELSVERTDLFKSKYARKASRACVDALKDGTKESIGKVLCRLGGSMFKIMCG